MKFKVRFTSGAEEEVSAARVLDSGEKWIDFVDGQDDLVLRVRVGDVVRIERVS